MPADSIPNCQCPGRYGRDENERKRGRRMGSFSKRTAVIHESQGWACKKATKFLKQDPESLMEFLLFVCSVDLYVESDKQSQEKHIFIDNKRYCSFLIT